jgi:2-polyprenyl-3-methyl-5-hydroxy-6-metoxy-1,4-benzoquinol methylase
MRCPVCDTSSWTDVTKFRLKRSDEKGRPIKMEQCDSCGFVSYPSRYESEEEIKKHYRESYRPPPQATGLYTGERKLQYHAYFLSPLMEEWKAAGIDKPVIGEVGSAFGMFLNWMRQNVPGADIHGTELTTSYKRIAAHEYGIDLKDDFDTSKKYDLIASYHVLEHQLDPDLRLKEYAACLKDSGVFYLSAPIWFRELLNTGGSGFDVEWYWAPDHINSWSEEHLEEIIRKAGLEIIMKNDCVYGNTYILKKASVVKEPAKIDGSKYKAMVPQILQAWELLQQNKTKEAIELWPNFPSAWANHYEFNRAEFHKSRVETDKFLKQAMESCPNSADSFVFGADVLVRYERYDEAFEVLTKANARKPNSPQILMGMANCYRMKALKETDEEKKAKLFRRSIDILRFLTSISTESIGQALTWIYADEANLPVALPDAEGSR